MARTIDIASVNVLAGDGQAFEVDSPTRANGCRISIARFNWPAGQLFRWRVYERERNGTLQPLTEGNEIGGVVPRRDGQPGEQPLSIELRWATDVDRDRIRFEFDVQQPFTAGVKIDWIA